VVTCEEGILSLSYYPIAFSKPQVTGDVSPRPHLPNEKEPSHCGDIGWDWFMLHQFDFQPQAFILATNCAITSPTKERETRPRFKAMSEDEQL
jgi:hypothetical protein